MGAVMMMGAGAGVDLPLLVDLLPDIEAAILSPGLHEQEEADDDDA